MKFLKAIIFLLSILSSCTLSKHNLAKLAGQDPNKYSVYFNKNAIRPLKKELPELYQLLKKGAIYYCHSCNPDYPGYLWSSELNDYIQNNRFKILKSAFLSNKNNLITAFGMPYEIQSDSSFTNLWYVMYPNVDRYYMTKTSPYSINISFRFNDKTGKLVAY